MQTSQAFRLFLPFVGVLLLGGCDDAKKDVAKDSKAKGAAASKDKGDTKPTASPKTGGAPTKAKAAAIAATVEGTAAKDGTTKVEAGDAKVVTGAKGTEVTHGAAGVKTGPAGTVVKNGDSSIVVGKDGKVIINGAAVPGM